MGEFANSTKVKILGYTICTLIAGLNAYLLYDTIGPIWLGAIISAMLAFAGWVHFIYKPRPVAPPATA
jgi:manganese transport protein